MGKKSSSNPVGFADQSNKVESRKNSTNLNSNSNNNTNNLDKETICNSSLKSYKVKTAEGSKETVSSVDHSNLEYQATKEATKLVYKSNSLSGLEALCNPTGATELVLLTNSLSSNSLGSISISKVTRPKAKLLDCLKKPLKDQDLSSLFSIPPYQDLSVKNLIDLVEIHGINLFNTKSAPAFKRNLITSVIAKEVDQVSSLYAQCRFDFKELFLNDPHTFSLVFLRGKTAHPNPKNSELGAQELDPQEPLQFYEEISEEDFSRLKYLLSRIQELKYKQDPQEPENPLTQEFKATQEELAELIAKYATDYRRIAVETVVSKPEARQSVKKFQEANIDLLRANYYESLSEHVHNTRPDANSHNVEFNFYIKNNSSDSNTVILGKYSGAKFDVINQGKLNLDQFLDMETSIPIFNDKGISIIYELVLSKVLKGLVDDKSCSDDLKTALPFERFLTEVLNYSTFIDKLQNIKAYRKNLSDKRYNPETLEKSIDKEELDAVLAYFNVIYQKALEIYQYIIDQVFLRVTLSIQDRIYIDILYNTKRISCVDRSIYYRLFSFDLHKSAGHIANLNKYLDDNNFSQICCKFLKPHLFNFLIDNIDKGVISSQSVANYDDSQVDTILASGLTANDGNTRIRKQLAKYLSAQDRKKLQDFTDLEAANQFIEQVAKTEEQVVAELESFRQAQVQSQANSQANSKANSKANSNANSKAKSQSQDQSQDSLKQPEYTKLSQIILEDISAMANTIALQTKLQDMSEDLTPEQAQAILKDIQEHKLSEQEAEKLIVNNSCYINCNIDTTLFQSKAKNISYSKFSISKNGGYDYNIKLSICETNDKHPLSIALFNGNMHDSITTPSVVSQIVKQIPKPFISKLRVVLDRGYSSLNNYLFILNNNLKFVIMMKNNLRYGKDVTSELFTMLKQLPGRVYQELLVNEEVDLINFYSNKNLSKDLSKSINKDSNKVQLSKEEIKAIKKQVKDYASFEEFFQKTRLNKSVYSNEDQASLADSLNIAEEFTEVEGSEKPITTVKNSQSDSIETSNTEVAASLDNNTSETSLELENISDDEARLILDADFNSELFVAKENLANQQEFLSSKFIGISLRNNRLSAITPALLGSASFLPRTKQAKDLDLDKILIQLHKECKLHQGINKPLGEIYPELAGVQIFDPNSTNYKLLKERYEQDLAYQDFPEVKALSFDLAITVPVILSCSLDLLYNKERIQEIDKLIHGLEIKLENYAQKTLKNSPSDPVFNPSFNDIPANKVVEKLVKGHQQTFKLHLKDEELVILKTCFSKEVTDKDLLKCARKGKQGYIYSRNESGIKKWKERAGMSFIITNDLAISCKEVDKVYAERATIERCNQNLHGTSLEAIRCHTNESLDVKLIGAYLKLNHDNYLERLLKQEFKDPHKRDLQTFLLKEGMTSQKINKQLSQIYVDICSNSLVVFHKELTELQRKILEFLDMNEQDILDFVENCQGVKNRRRFTIKDIKTLLQFPSFEKYKHSKLKEGILVTKEEYELEIERVGKTKKCSLRDLKPRNKLLF